MDECCLAGRPAGYCRTFNQFMPEPLRAICAGEDGKLTPEECAAYRREWHRIGGPLGLKIVQQASRTGQTPAVRHTALGMAVPAAARLKACKFLGSWTGRLCGH